MIPIGSTAQILAALELLAPVRREGRAWRTRCPIPDHEDNNPSFVVYPDGGATCFTRCDRSWAPRELCTLLDINAPESKTGLSVDELAAAKALDPETLRSFGVNDRRLGSGANAIPYVEIPYLDEAKRTVSVRKRLSLHGANRFRWRRGDKPIPYGLDRLEHARELGRILIVEGESDCWALSSVGIPALGLPGASTWKPEYAKYFQNLDVYVWKEPDAGGTSFCDSVCADLPQAKIIAPPDGIKDPSQLFADDAENFLDRLTSLMEAALTSIDIGAEVDNCAAESALSKCRWILESPDVFALLDERLRSGGYAGDTRPALIAYVALTSRLLDYPMKLAYVSPSGAGKNAAVDAVLPLFSEGAYYLLKASSPRALVYSEESFSQRIVIFAEADSIPEDGPAASAIRSLVSDREMQYETVEKVKGRWQTRRIHKLGPTGLITTSTKPLPHQASTRTLTVPIPDTPEQTRRVLRVQAMRRNGLIELPDHEPWTAAQDWLALAGHHQVFIPYAEKLADQVPTDSVRMRRDFDQLLTVIQTSAVIHQLRRNRNSEGRIVATTEDYRIARWLLEEVFATTASDGASPAIRETVETIARLSMGGSPVSQKQLATELGLSRSTTSYRVNTALRLNLLVNQASGRQTQHQLVVGDPLPDGNPLPTVEELVAHDISDESGSNSRIDPSDSKRTEMKTLCETQIELASNGSLNSKASPDQSEFEGFESFARYAANAIDSEFSQNVGTGSNAPDSSDKSAAFAFEETF